MGKNPTTHPHQIRFALGTALVGAILGYGLGSFDGSPFEGWLRLALLGSSFFLLAIG